MAVSETDSSKEEHRSSVSDNDSRSGSDSGSDSDSDSSSGSDSDSSSSSSSENEMALARPVFIRKPKLASEQNPSKNNNSTSRSALLARIDHHSKQVHTPETSGQFDGVNDTDDLDPEQEFSQWQQREAARMERDIAALRDLEKEQMELLKRRKAEEPVL